MTTNGHHATGLECPRCSDWIETPAELKEHFIVAHEMPRTKADSESLRAFAGTLERPSTKKGLATVRPEPRVTVVSGEPPHHTCPKCQTAIPCIWETTAMMDEQARLLKLAAAQMRAKAMGQPWGAPRKNADWTDEDVFSAWQSGLSVKAIATLFQAGQPTIARALKRAGAKG